MSRFHFELRVDSTSRPCVVRVEGPGTAATRAMWERHAKGEAMPCPACMLDLDSQGDCGTLGCYGADDWFFDTEDSDAV